MFFAAVATADAGYQIESWTTDKGLPQNTINSIVQTADGYLWLATLDGLVRFNGVKFKVFNKNNTPGIESNRFGQMLIDKHGNLWVSTEIGSVTLYRGGVFQDFAINRGTKKLALKIALNKDRELVVFGEDGIFQWNGEGFAPYVPVAGETNKSLTLWSRNGDFWYANEKTLYRFKDGNIKTFPLPESKHNSVITNLYEDKRGRIWIATFSVGMFIAENDELTPYQFTEELKIKHTEVKLEDREGNLWAISGNGVAIISPDGKFTYLTKNEGLSDSALNCVFEDSEGNIWLGTSLKGVNRLNRQSIEFYSTANGLTTEHVYPIFQAADDSIYMGGVLTRYADGKFALVSGDEGFLRVVAAIHEDRAGRLWLGYWGGVGVIENGKKSKIELYPDQTTGFVDIYEDRAGALWFASNAGLFRVFNNEKTRFTTDDGLPGNDVKIIHESPDGTLWIGTYGGLAKFENGKFVSFTTKDGLASNLVRSIYEDKENVLWIGSYDGGLTRLKDGKFTRYTSNDGLFNDGVFQILEDDRGNFWMSSNRGIYRVAKQQLNDFADGKITRIESIALGKADGLLETECNGGQQPAGIRARDGKLWFPTQGGVAVIDPNAVKINQIAPPVIIESALIDGEDVKLNDKIEIAAGKNNLEIAYTGLSFVKPEFVKFRYKLEGLQTDWVEAESRRTAYFSYLPPGEYTFRVTAANADGVWNADGKSLKIVVRPPFYRTWWFWVLATFSVFGIAYFFYRGRIERLEKSRLAQEDFSRKLLASQEQERQRIAAELHDSIGQSLLIIKNRAFLALSDLDEPEIVKEQLEELSESATGAIEECREISYNLRPYQIKRLGLTKTLEAIFRRISDVTEIETEIKLDAIDDVFSADAETNIYRIVQESVNNIMKHSAASKAELLIKKVGETVDISIKDNGRGFDKNIAKTNDNVRGGFGLVGIAERVRMLGGSYEIESLIGNGTNIKIKLQSQNHLR